MHSGRDLETKQNLAISIVEAAQEKLGAPLQAFTVVIEDVDRESFTDTEKAILDP
jgi:phenylpyruvate tautomerase PptA (4-oxalocrotonate tautomerase family)